jgi:hypothetical protein
VERDTILNWWRLPPPPARGPQSLWTGAGAAAYRPPVGVTSLARGQYSLNGLTRAAKATLTGALSYVTPGYGARRHLELAAIAVTACYLTRRSAPGEPLAGGSARDSRHQRFVSFDSIDRLGR